MYLRIAIALIILCITYTGFAATSFFTTKDGRLFCETGDLDGGYAPCNVSDTTGTALIKAVFRSARLVDTPVGSICVEWNSEVDAARCQDEIDAMKKILRVNTGTTKTGSTKTGTTISWEIWSLIEKIPEIKIPSAKQIENSVVEYISPFQEMHRDCIVDMNSRECIDSIRTVFSHMRNTEPSRLIAIVSAVFLYFIFWIALIRHAIRSGIRFKILWIVSMILFIIPAPILYYFFVKRPMAKQEEIRNPEVPSFF